MRALFSVLVAAIAATGLLAEPAVAQSPNFVGSHRDWLVYTIEQSGGTTCYIASVPKREDGNYSRRGNPHVLVTRLPGIETPQVSVRPGYAYKDGSNAEVTIGDREWQLFTRDEYAWANNSDEDRGLIAAMRAGSDMTVRGTSTLDTYSLDTYSLLGFTAAYQNMMEACS